MRNCYIKSFILIFTLMITLFITGCNQKPEQQETNFKYQIDRFEDIQILRYQIPDFETLDVRQKTLLYYLSEAAKCGRDITFDQNFKYNLFIKRILDAVVVSYTGDKATEEFEKFMIYTKKVWFASGIHHHYSTDKFLPEFSRNFLKV